MKLSLCFFLLILLSLYSVTGIEERSCRKTKSYKACPQSKDPACTRICYNSATCEILCPNPNQEGQTCNTTDPQCNPCDPAPCQKGVKCVTKDKKDTTGICNCVCDRDFTFKSVVPLGDGIAQDESRKDVVLLKDIPSDSYNCAKASDCLACADATCEKDCVKGKCICACLDPYNTNECDHGDGKTCKSCGLADKNCKYGLKCNKVKVMDRKCACLCGSQVRPDTIIRQDPNRPEFLFLKPINSSTASCNDYKDCTPCNEKKCSRECLLGKCFCSCPNTDPNSSNQTTCSPKSPKTCNACPAPCGIGVRCDVDFCYCLCPYNYGKGLDPIFTVPREPHHICNTYLASAKDTKRNYYCVCKGTVFNRDCGSGNSKPLFDTVERNNSYNECQKVVACTSFANEACCRNTVLVDRTGICTVDVVGSNGPFDTQCYCGLNRVDCPPPFARVKGSGREECKSKLKCDGDEEPCCKREVKFCKANLKDCYCEPMTAKKQANCATGSKIPSDNLIRRNCASEVGCSDSADYSCCYGAA